MKIRMLDNLFSLRLGTGSAALPILPGSDNVFLLDHKRQQRAASQVRQDWERRLKR